MSRKIKPEKIKSSGTIIQGLLQNCDFATAPFGVTGLSEQRCDHTFQSIGPDTVSGTVGVAASVGVKIGVE